MTNNNHDSDHIDEETELVNTSLDQLAGLFNQLTEGDITVTSSPDFIPNPYIKTAEQATDIQDRYFEAYPHLKPKPHSDTSSDIVGTPRPSAPKKPLSARPPRKPKPPVMEFICGCDPEFHTTSLSEVQTHMVTQTHTRSHLKVTAQKIKL